MNRQAFLKDMWNLCLSHVPSRTFRRFFYRRMLAECGERVQFLLHVHMMNPSRIHIGHRSVVNPYVILDGRGADLRIGNDVDIATYTHIWTADHDPHSKDHGSRSKPVTIEDHVWIASRVTVLPGVTIVRGAVVSTCSLVTKDIPPGMIVRGNPAKVCGRRRSDLSYKMTWTAPRFR